MHVMWQCWTSVKNLYLGFLTPLQSVGFILQMFSIFDISSLFLTQHPTQGHQLFTGLMQQAKNGFYSHAAVACQITEQRQDRILMVKVVPHRPTNVNRRTPPVTLKQIKHNRKTVQNNASTLLLFVALREHTAFIVSKQSGCVFSLSGENPHHLSVPSRNTVLKYHTDSIIFSKGTEQTPYKGMLVVQLPQVNKKRCLALMKGILNCTSCSFNHSTAMIYTKMLFNWW